MITDHEKAGILFFIDNKILFSLSHMTLTWLWDCLSSFGMEHLRGAHALNFFIDSIIIK